HIILNGDIHKLIHTIRNVTFRTKWKPNKGMHASERMSDDDKNDVMRYKAIIKKVGGKYEIDPAIICGIISRESRGGRAIHDKNGWGGLWKVDVTPNGGNHTPKGEWDSQEHLKQGTEIFINFIKKIQRKFPDWTKEQRLKGTTFHTSWTNQICGPCQERFSLLWKAFKLWDLPSFSARPF
uniref:Lysozyme g n=1 Tax=Salmo trutta TaxID=8032 RepID=A0A674EUZ2_SALTR